MTSENVTLRSVYSIMFYKWVDYPWVFKEGPFCRDGTLCPESQNYTWDFYFDKLLDIGGESFVLGDYNIKNSEFVNYSGFEWDMCGFDDLKRRVEDKNDLIFVGLEPKYDDQIVTFNTDAFAEEAIKNASLTGAKPENMVLAIPLIARAVHPASDMGYSNMIYDFNADPKGNGSVISSSNNTYYFFSQTRAGIIRTIQELNLTAAFHFGTTSWEVAHERGIPAAADLNFVGLWPTYKGQVVTFNTDAFAEEAIKNATLADMGYSSMIYDFHADPKGNGSVIFSPGNGYYFFSQTRAVDKLRLVKQHGLHGVMLESGYDMLEDLYPWDESSLFYALATKSV
ncbi:hypothetical protein FOL47_000849 [Perkinsus chesapeaki]|uniref:Uncharacterized protein n=1 Tax=Perkinsus chesapeaki TaxID=330153 RepID=A0A7J6MKP5_PERCH|nr:hypothetical protein FOL47_000849 [Perkinsus chesapeaki]